jgi:hypothetical protein
MVDGNRQRTSHKNRDSESWPVLLVILAVKGQGTGRFASVARHTGFLSVMKETFL